MGDGAGIGAAQPGAEIIPEGEAELGAGFGEAEKGIAAIAPAIAAGAAADLALGHLAANGVFSAVGVQRDVWPIEVNWSLFAARWPRRERTNR